MSVFPALCNNKNQLSYNCLHSCRAVCHHACFAVTTCAATAFTDNSLLAASQAFSGSFLTAALATTAAAAVAAIALAGGIVAAYSCLACITLRTCPDELLVASRTLFRRCLRANFFSWLLLAKTRANKVLLH